MPFLILFVLLMSNGSNLEDAARVESGPETDDVDFLLTLLEFVCTI